MPSERISMNVFVDFEQNSQAASADLYYSELGRASYDAESQYYLVSRPYLHQLLPVQYRNFVDCDMCLLTVLQTADMYVNHYENWCKILAYLFKFSGEFFEISDDLAAYVGQNYQEFEQYL